MKVEAQEDRALSFETDVKGPKGAFTVIPTAAELQGTTDPHFQLTRLCFRLTKEECKRVIDDLLHRYPEFRKTIGKEVREAAK